MRGGSNTLLEDSHTSPASLSGKGGIEVVRSSSLISGTLFSNAKFGGLSTKE